MQADTMKPAAQRRHYTSIFNALIRISREEGVARLWRGAAPTVLRAMAMNFGMMASYDQVSRARLFPNCGSLAGRAARKLDIYG